MEDLLEMHFKKFLYLDLIGKQHFLVVFDTSDSIVALSLRRTCMEEFSVLLPHLYYSLLALRFYFTYSCSN